MSPAWAYVLMLAGGFGALYFGAEWLVRGAARVASTMGVSRVVVGLTIVSLGTSAPELVVCIIANLDGSGDLLTGNILGSNVANIGLILGATALVRPLDVPNRVVGRDVPIMILVSLFFFPLVMDHELNQGEGAVLLGILVVYVAFTFRTPAKDMEEILEGAGDLSEERDGGEADASMAKDIALIALGAAGLGIGGHAIVSGAAYVATALGVSQDVIGFTVVALGTSLPELVTSLVAAFRRHADIAVGNVVGSNVFNLTAVAGTTSAIRSFQIDSPMLATEFGAVLALSVLVWPIVASARTVRRAEGLLLVLAYLGFMGWIALGS